MKRVTQERGFTLIELMVAVALSGIVIGFVFQIHNQMVGALRGQANLSEVVETVTAAREMMARELRLAGMGFPATGVQFGADPALDVWRGVDGTNDADGLGADKVDQLSIQRTDSDLQDATTVDDSANNNWVFPIAGADTIFNTTDPLMIATDTLDKGCAPVAIAVDAAGVTVAKTVSDLGGVCATVGLAGGNKVKLATIRRIAYRLDPAVGRLEMGVLQRAINGGAWEDIGIGFTNLQIAIRYYEPNDAVDDPDLDGDTKKDWYSSDNMLVTSGRPTDGQPMEVTISIEGRNLRSLDSLSSSATPPYTADLANMTNNSIGDFGAACAGCQYDPAGVDLATTVLPRYQFPNHVYRASTTTVWLRSRLESL